MFHLYHNPINDNLHMQWGVAAPEMLGAGLELVCRGDLWDVNQWVNANIEWQRPSVTDTARPHKDRAMTYVYLMRDNNTGFIKIGTSRRPEYRERTLQSEKPCITLLKKWWVASRMERELHRRFHSQRIRGEWFTLTDADIDAIDRILSHVESL